MSFCSLTKGITLKICWFCLVPVNSILLNLSCVWIEIASVWCGISHVTTKQYCTYMLGRKRHVLHHTPSIAFWHLPPNSARFSYATEGALFTSAQLSTDAISALRKPVRVLKHDCRSNLEPKHARKHEAHPPWVRKVFRLDSNDFGFIWAGISKMFSYKRNVRYNTVVCNKLTTVWAPTKNCSLADSFLDPMVEGRMS